MKVHKLTTPLTNDQLEKLQSGDQVLITGSIYTARDAAHKKLIELIDAGKELPFDLKGEIIYFVGPTPARPGELIGSAGPTTAYRMDDYSIKLIELGLKGMVGKGGRGPEVIDAMKKHKAIYFGAIGGLGAVISKTVKDVEVVAYEELLSEAIRKFRVVDFPCFVVNDLEGHDAYKIGQKKYRRDN